MKFKIRDNPIRTLYSSRGSARTSKVPISLPGLSSVTIHEAVLEYSYNHYIELYCLQISRLVLTLRAHP
jgi:hypothetical protein